MTLVEIMIVISIIGLLAVIAIPSFTRSRQRAQNTAFKNDLRVLSDEVFNRYALDTGDFPPDVPSGVAPTGIVDYLAHHFEWSEQSSIGGIWDWDRGTSRVDKIHGGIAYAALSIVSPTRTTSQMQEIDKDVDDGDLAKGLFRSVGAGTYALILEP